MPASCTLAPGERMQLRLQAAGADNAPGASSVVATLRTQEAMLRISAQHLACAGLGGHTAEPLLLRVQCMRY
jgi:hypothetical protein